MKKLLFLFVLTVALPIAALAQGNTWQEATLIKNGETIKANLDGSTSDLWFMIEVPDDGVVEFAMTPDANSSMWVNKMILNWKDGDQMANRKTSDHNAAKETKWLTVKNAGKGTYYLNIHINSGKGDYQLTYTFTPSKYRNDNSNNDEGGKGDILSNGSTSQGHLGYRDATNYTDQDDWYIVEVPQDGDVEFLVTPESNSDLWLDKLELAWKDGDKMVNRKVTDGSAAFDTKRLTTPVGSGTYYFHIHNRGGQGGYDLAYNFTPNSYPNDPEPNDVPEQATPIKDGQTLTAHLGYRDGKGMRDEVDWFKIDGHPTMLTVTYTKSKGDKKLSVDKFYLAKKNGDKMDVVSGTYSFGVTDTQTHKYTDLDENGEYYLYYHSNAGEGNYSIRVGAPERVKGSNIRVSCGAPVGRAGCTRLGVPSPLFLKVENIGANNTGSFFMAIPTTPDIEILYADIPTEEGTVRYQHDDIAVNVPDEGDCALFIIPNLGPYESYTFALYTQGRVSNQSRSRSPMMKISLKERTSALFASLRSEADKFKEEFEWADVEEDGLTVATFNACMNTWALPKESRQEIAQAIGQTERDYRVGAGGRKPQAVPIVNYTKTVCESVAKASIPGMATFNALKASGQIANSLINTMRRKLWHWIWKDLGYVPDEAQVMDCKEGVNRIVRSWDPNEMVGPVGVGDKNYVAETRTVDYRILFENKKEATAPAYRIRISDVLDENVFDISSVRFGETSHEGAQYNWKMTREGNRLSWDIEGIELPPNVNAPEGEGYVSFSIDLKPGLKNGTQIKNKATIIFDYNEAIETNEHMNTLDLMAPIAEMKEATVEGNTATVTCTATDEGAGVSHYLFYASLNGGEAHYLGQNTEPTFSFDADENADYTVYVLAVDRVGNTQTAAPATLTFNPTGIHGITYAPAATNGWAVYRLNGTTAATGQGVPNVQLPAGIYIIREGGKSRKVVVK